MLLGLVAPLARLLCTALQHYSTTALQQLGHYTTETCHANQRRMRM